MRASIHHESLIVFITYALLAADLCGFPQARGLNLNRMESKWNETRVKQNAAKDASSVWFSCESIQVQMPVQSLDTNIEKLNFVCQTRLSFCVLKLILPIP